MNSKGRAGLVGARKIKGRGVLFRPTGVDCFRIHSDYCCHHRSLKSVSRCIIVHRGKSRISAPRLALLAPKMLHV